MKTIAITGKESCEILEKPMPTAKEDYVVVKIHAAPLCTEYTDYRDGCSRAEFERGDESPDCLGHEAAGEGHAGFLVREVSVLSFRRIHSLSASA